MQYFNFVVQFTLGNSNFSQSSIPRSSEPFLHTTKKSHGNSKFLCLIVTLHEPICHILELLYALNWSFLFMHLFNSAIERTLVKRNSVQKELYQKVLSNNRNNHTSILTNINETLNWVLSSITHYYKPSLT